AVEAVAEPAVRPAVNLEDERVAFALFVTERPDEQAFDVELIRPLPFDHFGFGDGEVFQLRVGPGDFARLPAPDRRHPDVVGRAAVADRVSDHLPVARDVELAVVAILARDLRDFAASGGRAEDVAVHPDAAREVNGPAVGRPVQPRAG